jgi:16S rRNA (uracil1498-N3)-methyltransferase
MAVDYRVVCGDEGTVSSRVRMARRYHVSPLPDGGRASLPTDVAHHLVRVMRVRVGDDVVLFDGAGRECVATIHEIAGTGRNVSVTTDVSESRASTREPTVRVEVVFAPPKGNRAEWLFEHGTEVGITAYHPVSTARAVGGDRRERWQRIATAATGQCDRARIPTVHATRPLEALLADETLPAERYVADESGPPIRAAESDHAILLVGPEGGLTDDEIALAESRGFERRNLGVTTLRAEMAVVAGAVLLLQPR